MIKVLVVEDSAVLRELLIHILEADPAIQVIGTANNGEEAVIAAQSKQPDVITMDINMPRMNGFEATRQIMELAPKPIVIVTSIWNPKEVSTSFRAVEAGAVAVIATPPGIGHPDHQPLAQELVQTVKSMAEVKVVRRWARTRTAANAPVRAMHEAPKVIMPQRRRVQLVAIGTSTGGPLALQMMLAALPPPLPVPIVIVQHMAAGFVTGFVEWLGQSAGHPTHVVTDDEALQAGHVYVAPDGFQMKMKDRHTIKLTQDDPEHGLLPSVSYLFRSVAQTYGAQAVGVLLTGMGRDGAAELKMMRDAGALTFAQDKESSIVHGMPGEAIRLEAATYILPPEKIAGALHALWSQQDHHLSPQAER